MCNFNGMYQSRMEIAQSLPGVGPILAALVVVEIETTKRFPSASKLLSYARPDPVRSLGGG